jgi:hypothetical protein
MLQPDPALRVGVGMRDDAAESTRAHARPCHERKLDTLMDLGDDVERAARGEGYHGRRNPTFDRALQRHHGGVGHPVTHGVERCLDRRERRAGGILHLGQHAQRGFRERTFRAE